MTDTPMGSADPTTYQAHVRAEADAFLAAVAAGPPSAQVASCPGWTLHSLVDHLGGIHQWATAILQGSGPDYTPTPIPEGATLGPWYADHVDRLLATLADTDPTAPCWTFQRARRTASFWSRRQAHEVAVHRVDAELAVGMEPTYDAALAADGIAEIFDVVVPRAARRLGRPDLAAPILLACTDRPERWLLRIDSDDADRPLEAAGPEVTDGAAADAGAVIRASAATLLLTLWRRVDSDAAVTVEGDHDVARRFLASQLTF